MANRAVIAFGVVLALASRAWANDCGGAPCCCDDNTSYPGKVLDCPDGTISSVTPEEAAKCWASDSSTPQGGGQVNPAVIETLGAIAFVLILPLAPGHVIMLMDPHFDKEADSARANAAYKAVLDEIATNEQKGREVSRLAIELREGERDAPNDTKLAAGKLKPLPFQPPKLVAPMQRLAYECDRAMIVAWYREGWPLEDFESFHDFQTKCPGDTPDPSSPPAGDPAVCKAEDRSCGGTTKPVCCPAAKPIYNPCDDSCYRTGDFRAARDEAGMRCSHYTDCGSNIK